MKALLLYSIIASVAWFVTLGWFWSEYGWGTAVALFILFFTNNISLRVVRELDKRLKK
jgi:hypothetical protein